jgi:hypothetical protein
MNDTSCLSLLAQQGREFNCNGCSIIELLIAGSYGRIPYLPPHFSLLSGSEFLFHTREFAARRGVMRMLKQEDHEVFLSLAEWRSVEPKLYPPGWSFTEEFDGRLLLLPFFHRAQLHTHHSGDVSLALHMDQSRLWNLELVAKAWGGPISIVIIMCVAVFKQPMREV